MKSNISHSARPAICLMVMMLELASIRSASAATVEASSWWFHDWDRHQSTQRRCAGGLWSLGRNDATYAGITTSAGPKAGMYPDTDSIIARRGFGDEFAEAYSAILGPVGPGPCFDYTLVLSASADGGRKSASAVARGEDPQMVLAPAGSVSQTLALAAGSVMARGETGTALVDYILEAYDLMAPLATVHFHTVPGTSGIDAIVTFNPDPRLAFFKVDTTDPILPVEVELMLETSPLGAIGGLPTDVPLFTYVYDLSTTLIPPAGAMFGSRGEAHAFSPTVDLNDDGAIDGADLAILFQAWGPGGGRADVNLDLVVDGADVGVLYQKWTGDPSLRTVPEPEWGIFASSLAFLLTRGRCIRHTPDRNS